MPICTCFETDDQREQRLRSAEIDARLKKDLKTERSIIKLLLLGAGDAGKSTFAKQLRILHGDPYSEADLKKYRPVVMRNILQAVLQMIMAMKDLGVAFTDNSNLAIADRIQSLSEHVALDLMIDVDESVRDCIRLLWMDDGFKSVLDFERRCRFQIGDSAGFFLDGLDRIFNTDYLPTVEDVLHVRAPTTGIVETRCIVKNVEFRVVDVGGQRSERRKWAHCFDNIVSIIFMSAISEYDQVLFEDESQNRLTESLELFAKFASYPFFKDTSIILFLNKIDVFREKIACNPRSLSMFFPEYDGRTAEEAFILSLFKKRYPSEKGLLYSHYTCATDTECMQKVFKSVEDTLRRYHMRRFGLE
eukprot:Opistho-2@61061